MNFIPLESVQYMQGKFEVSGMPIFGKFKAQDYPLLVPEVETDKQACGGIQKKENHETFNRL